MANSLNDTTYSSSIFMSKPRGSGACLLRPLRSIRYLILPIFTWHVALGCLEVYPLTDPSKDSKHRIASQRFSGVKKAVKRVSTNSAKKNRASCEARFFYLQDCFYLLGVKHDHFEYYQPNDAPAPVAVSSPSNAAPKLMVTLSDTVRWNPMAKAVWPP